MSIKKSISILVVLAIIGTIIIFSLASGGGKVEYTTVKATIGKIIQTVSETGTVKAVSEIDLNFLNTGKIEKLTASIGDEVKKGDVLAELDYSGLVISRNEAQANLDVNNETLRKLQAGATAEEIAVAKANVGQAKKSYESAKSELEKIISASNEVVAQAEKSVYDLESSDPSNITSYEQSVITAETKLKNTKTTYQNTIDDAIDSALNTSQEKLAVANSSLDAINRILTDDDAEDLLGIKKPSYLIDTKANYGEAKTLCDDTNSAITNVLANRSVENTNLMLSDMGECLDMVFNALQSCYSTLENTVTNLSFTLADLDTFKASIEAEQTLISTAKNSVQSKDQSLVGASLDYNTYVSQAEDSLSAAKAAYDDALKAAKNTLNTAYLSRDQQKTSGQSKVDASMEAWDVAQAQLNQIIAPANKHDISLQNARIRQAQAALEAINKQIENSIIKAPIDGTITKVNYEVGEQVMSGSSAVISMLGDSQYEIEVLISEADIAKVKKDDMVEITLDAYGDDIKFTGQVSFIEPAETIIQDVIYYKVTVNFKPEKYDIKSGMTANVIITTAQKDNVLMIPGRAVIQKNGSGKFVRVLEGVEMKEEKVELGLRGDEGMVEIISGIKDGQEIVTSVKNN